MKEQTHQIKDHNGKAVALSSSDVPTQCRDGEDNNTDFVSSTLNMRPEASHVEPTGCRLVLQDSWCSYAMTCTGTRNATKE